MSGPDDHAAAGPPQRLFVASGGFFNPALRRILRGAGYLVTLGLPGPGDLVGVWGSGPTAWRGAALARRRGAGLVRVEDAFLRSVRPGREGEAPLGLLIDRTGVHFDARAPSDLETLLATQPLDDPALLARARQGIARLRAGHLSKYCAFDPDLPAPMPGYVLVIDQTLGDASVTASGGAAAMAELLALARAEHPGQPLLIKTHPETARGLRSGHFGPADGPACSDPVSPWHLLAGAAAVYTLSSQLGFEAILAGHRPVVLGQPFYAGWGLTDDRAAPARRGRRLTGEQMFAAAMILAPAWHDPYHNRPCTFETALDALEAQARAWREDHRGWVATGMRLWKRQPLQRAFGRVVPVRFADDPARAVAIAAASNRRLMVWAGKTTPALDAAGAVRVEDGFMRSRGLGAALVPALSLALDDLGIYYDPHRPSRLESLIATPLPDHARARTERLVAALIAAGLSKYNLPGAGLPPDLPAGRRILVPGQVEDDASIRLGGGDIRTNRALLLATRQANRGAVILYKPHPDVEAGLRPGAVPDAAEIADAVLARTDPVAALAGVSAVWTMTSALGFEALLRGVPVTCLGAPFYAGWGLTTDLGPPFPRRTARPDMLQLAHAALIAYPRYFDPVTGLPCPPEVILARLAAGTAAPRSPANRLLARAQGIMASQSWLWR